MSKSSDSRNYAGAIVDVASIAAVAVLAALEVVPSDAALAVIGTVAGYWAGRRGRAGEGGGGVPPASAGAVLGLLAFARGMFAGWRVPLAAALVAVLAGCGAAQRCDIAQRVYEAASVANDVTVAAKLAAAEAQRVACD